jgi:hypothetical protein
MAAGTSRRSSAIALESLEAREISLRGNAGLSRFSRVLGICKLPIAVRRSMELHGEAFYKKGLSSILGKLF